MSHGSLIFVPQKPPEEPSTPDQKSEYLWRMFQDISNNLNNIYDGRILQELNVAPPKPENGMIVYADGTNWNPGSGEGFYGYEIGAWVKL